MSKGYQSIITAKLRCIGGDKEIRGKVSKTGCERTHAWFFTSCFGTSKLRKKLNT